MNLIDQAKYENALERRAHAIERRDKAEAEGMLYTVGLCNILISRYEAEIEQFEAMGYRPRAADE